MSGTGKRQANHLAGQTSPYLLQHVHNPVDWYPWTDRALERSRELDRPIFLSIGYAACHWCHVMERESFEDDEVAAYLNRHFVAIKVDREERPDLDEIYMNAVQLMQQSGGWPLSVFLTPSLEPFTGGTYFPPRSAHGRIGFLELLQRVHDAWTQQRSEIQRSADQLVERLRQLAVAGDTGSSLTVGRAECARAAGEFSGRFDAQWGGFSPAPKFPPDGALALLLREHQRSGEIVPLQMVRKTLDAMALGGMYDHVGGGFARYSVDEHWLVPHFEKMLYNQALLVPLYLDGWVVTEQPLYRRVARQTLDFVLRELTDREGAFHSSLDADSEGREGLFYVWTPDEVLAALGPADGARFNEVYGITAEGNFEGRNIPHLLHESLASRSRREGPSEEQLDAQLAPLRRRLLESRERRVRPATDDKVLTAWNGLMISAFARAHAILGGEHDLAAARSAADFVLERLSRGDRLLVSFRDGRAHLNGYLDDHAFFCRGLLDLYEAGFERRYLDAAVRFARSMVEHFEDRRHGGFFFTSDDHESLLLRTRSLHDGALPSGYGVATEVLLRLGSHLDDEALRKTGQRALQAGRSAVEPYPAAFTALLAAADFDAGPVIELALVGEAGSPALERLLRVVRRRYLPRRLLAQAERGGTDSRTLFAGRTDTGEPALAYVCRDYACQEPTGDPEVLARLLDQSTAG